MEMALRMPRMSKKSPATSTLPRSKSSRLSPMPTAANSFIKKAPTWDGMRTTTLGDMRGGLRCRKRRAESPTAVELISVHPGYNGASTNRAEARAACARR
eukprot:7310717-Prymnesium_polylepis.1